MHITYGNQFSKSDFKNNSAKERVVFQKHSVCAAARAADVYNYKHKQRVASKLAVLKNVTRLGAIIFCV